LPNTDLKGHPFWLPSTAYCRISVDVACSSLGHRTYPLTQNVLYRGDKGPVCRPREKGIHHFQIQSVDGRTE